LDAPFGSIQYGQKVGLTKLKKTYTMLYIMLENDFKGLEKVVSIVEPLNIVFTITNLVNLEEVEISIGNTLNNHALLSILQVLKVDNLTCNDFIEMIAMSLMDLDKIA
jgi:hypothetical protein